MPPQSPLHPAPPEPTNLSPGEAVHAPQNYTAPEFSQSATPTQSSAPPNQDYRFILESKAPLPKKSFSSSTKSPLIRVVLVLGGIFLLLVIFTTVKNAFNSSGSNASALLTVAEDQEEISHLANKAAGQQGITIQTLNSAVTTEASMNSDQFQLLTYYKKSGLKKFNTTLISTKVSKTTDAQLLAAGTSGLYDQTYQTVMQSQLSTYALNLKQAYRLTSGSKGRKLLAAETMNAQLLLLQLNSPTS